MSPFAITFEVNAEQWLLVEDAVQEHPPGSDYDLLYPMEIFFQGQIRFEPGDQGGRLVRLDAQTWLELGFTRFGWSDSVLDAGSTRLVRGYPAPLLNMASRIAQSVDTFRADTGPADARVLYQDPDSEVELSFVRRLADVYLSSNWPEDEFWAIVAPVAEYLAGADRMLSTLAQQVAARAPLLLAWRSGRWLAPYVSGREIRSAPLESQ